MAATIRPEMETDQTMKGATMMEMEIQGIFSVLDTHRTQHPNNRSLGLVARSTSILRVLHQKGLQLLLKLLATPTCHKKKMGGLIVAVIGGPDTFLQIPSTMYILGTRVTISTLRDALSQSEGGESYAQVYLPTSPTPHALFLLAMRDAISENEDDEGYTEYHLPTSPTPHPLFLLTMKLMNCRNRTHSLRAHYPTVMTLKGSDIYSHWPASSFHDSVSVDKYLPSRLVRAWCQRYCGSSSPRHSDLGPILGLRGRLQWWH